MLTAIEIPSIELILFIIAILIAVVGKIVEASRGLRRRSLENQKRRQRRFGEEEKATPPVVVRRPPMRSAPIPMPTMTLPFPTAPDTEPTTTRPFPMAPDTEPTTAPPPQPRRRLPHRPARVAEPAAVAPPTPARPRPVRRVAELPATIHEPAVHPVVRQLENHEGLQAAYIMFEIMGPPRALRPYGRR